MIITVNGEKKEIENNVSLRQILLTYTPYGEEATIIVQNGTYYKSIDLQNDDIKVAEGDTINIVPLIIGG